MDNNNLSSASMTAVASMDYEPFDRIIHVAIHVVIGENAPLDIVWPSNFKPFGSNN